MSIPRVKLLLIVKKAKVAFLKVKTHITPQQQLQISVISLPTKIFQGKNDSERKETIENV